MTVIPRYNVQPAWHLYYDVLHNGTVPDSVIDTLAKGDIGWLTASTDLDLPDGSRDWSVHADIARRITERNPDFVSGWYFGAASWLTRMDPLWPYVTEADCLHRVGIPSIQGSALYGTIPYTGWVTKVPNYMSKVVQDKLIAGALAWAQQTGHRHLLIDNFDPKVGVAIVAGAQGFAVGPAGVVEGPAETAGWWEVAMATFYERLRWAMEQIGGGTMVNGVAPIDPPISNFNGPDNVMLTEYGSMAMVEHCHPGYKDPAYFEGLLRATKRVTDRRRGAYWSVTPSLAVELGDPSKGQPDGVHDGMSLKLRRFWTGAYKLIEEPPLTKLGYHPHLSYRGWDPNVASAPPYAHPPFAWFDPDWENPLLDIGQPLGSYVKHPSTHPSLADGWTRRFSGGMVAVNPHGTKYAQVTTEGRLYRVWDGGTVNQALAAPGYLANIPPGEAWLMVHV